MDNTDLLAYVADSLEYTKLPGIVDISYDGDHKSAEVFVLTTDGSVFSITAKKVDDES